MMYSKTNPCIDIEYEEVEGVSFSPEGIDRALTLGRGAKVVLRYIVNVISNTVTDVINPSYADFCMRLEDFGLDKVSRTAYHRGLSSLCSRELLSKVSRHTGSYYINVQLWTTTEDAGKVANKIRLLRKLQYSDASKARREEDRDRLKRIGKAEDVK